MKRNKKIVEKKVYGIFIFAAALALILTILIALLIAYIFNITELISIKLNSDLGVFAVVIFITATIVFGLVIS